jgi:hypothetical protein
MKVTELINGFDPLPKSKPYNIIDGFEIWTTNEEDKLLEKLKEPVKLRHLSEHDQVRIQALIRKSLVTKVGDQDPTVVANEKYKN